MGYGIVCLVCGRINEMDVNNMNQALNEEKLTFNRNDCIGYMIENKEKYDIVKLGKSFLLAKKIKSSICKML